MATNKHATIRYQALDRCFKNSGRRYYIDDLIEACNKSLYDYTGVQNGVKRRQVYEDITFMESSQGWSIPLERVRDGHKVFFRYEDRSFSINSQPLTTTEQNHLKEALLTLSRFKGMPQFEWVDELITKLDSEFGLTINGYKIVQFEQNNYLKGLDNISTLYKAALYKKALRLKYKSYRTNVETDNIFHPYFLKQYNNRWFVFGLVDGSKKIENFALDRIQSISNSSHRYIPNSTIDFESYFEDIVGVNLPLNETIQKVILKVSNRRLPWIHSKPLHGSQKEIEKGKTYTKISLDIIPNHELEALLLSFGDDLEILEPKKLRTSVKHKISILFQKYQS